MNKKYLIVIVMMITFILGVFCIFKISPFSVEDICKLSKQNCPDSKRFNEAFKILYKKFGNGKTIPYYFEKGEIVYWGKLLENIEYINN